jgi:hypothetical protein
MLARGAFTEWMVDGRLPRNFKVFVQRPERLPWNEAAQERVAEVRLVEHVEGHWQGSSYRRRNWINSHDETRAVVKVPHWDYDGVDPLIAREPWERAQADKLLGHMARWRRQDAETRWSIEVEAREAEAAAELEAAGQPFTWAAGPEG